MIAVCPSCFKSEMVGGSRKRKLTQLNEEKQQNMYLCSFAEVYSELAEGWFWDLAVHGWSEILGCIEWLSVGVRR